MQNLSDRYFAFQQQAVHNITADFHDNPRGRFLLVVPTGGGKTTIAVKAIASLYAAQILGEQDRVLWVVHRDELRIQASETFARYAIEHARPELPAQIDVVMLSGVKSYLANHPQLCLAVIDEAHHVAANSYQPLFLRQNLGILGLTATPSRHDGQPLQFDHESYSIGFPDLVSMGVLLKPNIISVAGGAYDIPDIGPDSSALEVLDNAERNSKILASLEHNSPKLRKIIIYVGTRSHAQNLYALLKASPISNSFDEIALILGDERRRYVAASCQEVAGESRVDFIATLKKLGRAIIVNVDVLTEGYDDPTVNCVVMARPTSSKLVYMQAVGRAVRMDLNNLGKEAYVIEVTDDLPNIQYRIDNRWLYSDVSDILEPAVLDLFYSSDSDREDKFTKLFNQYHVSTQHRTLPVFRQHDRVTVLLFKIYSASGQFGHIPIVITSDTRRAASDFFNFLASRMKILDGMNIEQVFRPLLEQIRHFPVLEELAVRKMVFHAMENSWELVRPKTTAIADPILAGRPWISFVAFRLEVSTEALGVDLLDFTEDMLNRDGIRSTLRGATLSSNFFLLRFPLPLQGTWGVFLSSAEFETVREAVEKLSAYRDIGDGVEQWAQTLTVLGTANLPIEQRHVQSIPTIVREDLDYFRALDSNTTGDLS